MIYDLHLRIWPRQDRDKTARWLCQRSFSSKVIVRTNTQTHIHRTYCSTRTTKLVGTWHGVQCVFIFRWRHAMLARYQPWFCVSVCLSQGGVLSERLNRASWFSTAYPTLCFKEIRAVPKINGTILLNCNPNSNVGKFRHDTSALRQNDSANSAWIPFHLRRDVSDECDRLEMI